MTKWLAFKNIINSTFVGQISVPKEIKNFQNDGTDFTYSLVIKVNDNLLIFWIKKLKFKDDINYIFWQTPFLQRPMIFFF